MSINVKQITNNEGRLVIRKKVNGLSYGDPGVPEWAMKEMEKDMGLPVSDSVVVYKENEMENVQEQQTNLVTEAQTAEVTVSLKQELGIELKKGQYLELLALAKTEGVSNVTLLQNARIVSGRKLADSWITPGPKALVEVLEQKLFKQAA